MQTQERSEIRALTGLRIVAAVWVVLIHFQTVMSHAFGGYLGPIRPIVMSGWLGVDLFFMLSGFVLTYSYLDRMGPDWRWRGVLAFGWARFVRIWPLWALLTVVAGVFLALSGTDQDPRSDHPRLVTLWSALQQLALVQMWHRDVNLGSSFVAPGWSLSVEVAAYAAFPVLVLAAHRLRRLPVWVLAASAVGATVPVAALSYEGGLADYWLPWPARIAGAFTAGMLTCLAVQGLEVNARARRLAPAAAVVAVLEIGGIVYWADVRVLGGQANQTGVAVVLFPLLIGALALSDSGVARFLSRPAVVLGGRISFALYLVHTVVLDVVLWLQTVTPAMEVGRPAYTFISANLLPLSVGLAWALWRYVEEPARIWLRHRGLGSPTSIRPRVPGRYAAHPDRWPSGMTDDLPTVAIRFPATWCDSVRVERDVLVDPGDVGRPS